MNETYFVLFIIGRVAVSWILKATQKDGMEPCSRPLRGPKDNAYPEVYGPTGGNGAKAGTRQDQGSTQQESGPKEKGPDTRSTQQESGPKEKGPDTKPSVDNSKCSISGQVQKTQGGPIQPGPGMYAAWSDDDVMDSTTMTQNPLYASTFQFQVPSYKMDLSFPNEGPPQPYLTDFSKFHR